MTYILSRGARYINPCLGEECTRSEHEEDVEDSMDGIGHHVAKVLWWGHVVTQAPYRVRPMWPRISRFLYRIQQQIAGQIKTLFIIWS